MAVALGAAISTWALPGLGATARPPCGPLAPTEPAVSPDADVALLEAYDIDPADVAWAVELVRDIVQVAVIDGHLVVRDGAAVTVLDPEDGRPETAFATRYARLTPQAIIAARNAFGAPSEDRRLTAHTVQGTTTGCIDQPVDTIGFRDGIVVANVHGEGTWRDPVTLEVAADAPVHLGQGGTTRPTPVRLGALLVSGGTWTRAHDLGSGTLEWTAGDMQERHPAGSVLIVRPAVDGHARALRPDGSEVWSVDCRHDREGFRVPCGIRHPVMPLAVGRVLVGSAITPEVPTVLSLIDPHDPDPIDRTAEDVVVTGDPVLLADGTAVVATEEGQVRVDGDRILHLDRPTVPVLTASGDGMAFFVAGRTVIAVEAELARAGEPGEVQGPLWTDFVD